MSRERNIEARLVAHCKKLGVYTRKFVSPSNAGVPDRILVGTFGTIFLELKAPGKKPDPLQQREINVLNNCAGPGTYAYWTDSWEGALMAVQRVDMDIPVSHDKTYRL